MYKGESSMLLKALISIMSIFGVAVAAFMGKDIYKHKNELNPNTNTVKCFCIGFIGNFCDALGIGSFAVVVALNRVMKQISDKLLVGTLIVGVCSLPTIISFIYSVNVIEVDADILIATTIAAGIGTFLGARVISGFSERKIRLVLGVILFVVGCIQIYKLLSTQGIVEGSTGLSGIYFIIAVIGCFVTGFLQGLGLGYFAPTMALLITLGLSSKAIYPVMFAGAGIGALLGSFAFISKGTYERKASPFIAIGGMIGVFIAVTLVKQLPVAAINWLVGIIMLYIGSEYFIKGIKNKG